MDIISSKLLITDEISPHMSSSQYTLIIPHRANQLGSLIKNKLKEHQSNIKRNLNKHTGFMREKKDQNRT